MTIKKLINKWDLKRTFLARGIEMHTATFANKMNPKHSSDFTRHERRRLVAFINKMGKDLVLHTTPKK